jgi:serine/threonine protein kinase/WD40 repeat protein
MSAPSTGPDPEEAILAAFVRDLEERGPSVVAEYSQRYPQLAGEFQALAEMNQVLAGAGAVSEPQQLQRLGEFRIVRRLARGGMGEIYEAVQERLGRRVAVKVIRRGHISPQSRERFLREQQVLARLHQTHIVPIHAAGEERDLQYFAMPYIEGAGLHHVIAAMNRLEDTASGSKTPTLAELAARVAADSGGEMPSPTTEADAARSRALAARVHEGQQAQKVPAPATTSPISEGKIAARSNLTFSVDYFRSVAAVLADAAEALHHAHGVQVLHRDVKPANIMVDTSGQCWIIDFGLAGVRNDVDTNCADRPGADLPAEPAAVSGILGTPHYMAPEQFEAKADPHTDVWGLGVTLYELLTLQRAFSGTDYTIVRRQIQTVEPPPPRTVIANVPRDLAAICARAMQKEPAGRYRSAEAFADDLRRWLRSEPTQARPAWVWRRVGLWTWRNPAWAMALALGLVIAVALVWATISHLQEREEVLRRKTLAAEEESRRRRREALVEQVHRIRLTPHSHNWRDRAFAGVRDAAEIRKDSALQGVAAATLSGLEARQRKRIKGIASSVAFDATARWLLIGGTEKTAAKLCDTTTGVEVTSGRLGWGPVTFDGDGTPLQFAADQDDPWSLVLWNVAKRQVVRRFKIPPNGTARPTTTSSFHRLAMTPDGRWLAAAPSYPDGKDTILVWNAATGQLIRRIGATVQTLALSADGTLLAGGDDKGHITVWPLPKGEPIATFQVDRSGVEGLAFQRERRHREDEKPGEDQPGWLLACAESSGSATIWDLHTKHARTFCRADKLEEAYTVAFSPDGTTLAVGGHGGGTGIDLWDFATGHLLLHLGGFEDFVTGLAFSADGRRLAVSNDTGFAPDIYTTIWELQDGRGIRTLRGLDAPVVKARYSPDGRFLAAISTHWQVAVWEAQNGALRHVFDVPKGWTADNAGLAFSKDNRRLAFSAGKHARMWDVESGKRLNSWTLPLGLGDTLAFHRQDKLLLCRFEAKNSKFGLSDEESFKKGPRVCRLRDLLAANAIDRPIKEIADFAVVNGIQTPSDGRYFLIDGWSSAKSRRWTAKAIDAVTGKELCSLSLGEGELQQHALVLDPTGKLLAMNGPEQQVRRSWPLVSMPSGKTLDHLDFVGLNGPIALSPGGELWVSFNEVYAWLVESRGVTKPLVILGIDVQWGRPQFNVAGTHLVCTGHRGSVVVCDLKEIQEQLAPFGLGW